MIQKKVPKLIISFGSNQISDFLHYWINADNIVAYAAAERGRDVVVLAVCIQLVSILDISHFFGSAASWPWRRLVPVPDWFAAGYRPARSHSLVCLDQHGYCWRNGPVDNEGEMQGKDLWHPVLFIEQIMLTCYLQHKQLLTLFTTPVSDVGDNITANSLFSVPIL